MEYRPAILAVTYIVSCGAHADELSSFMAPGAGSTPDLVAGDYPLDHSSDAAKELKLNTANSNISWLTQEGNDQQAVIDQGGGLSNRAIISQSGNASVSYILQSGSRNFAMIRQR